MNGEKDLEGGPAKRQRAKEKDRERESEIDASLPALWFGSKNLRQEPVNSCVGSGVGLHEVLV
jgi:hypothetical protein